MNETSSALDELKQAVLRNRLKRRVASHVAEGGGAPLPIADRNLAIPLSWAQQRLWFLDQLDHAAGAAYHMPVALRLSGTLDRDALRATLDRVIARHENLRTSFVNLDGAPTQVIAPADSGFALAEQDLRGLDARLRDETVQRMCADEARAPFDLSAGPLIRGCLLHLGEQEHVLLFTQHHIISDGWSIGLLIREVSALYAAFVEGLPDPLPPLEIQYADYAVWQRQWLSGDALKRQVDFWRMHLIGAPALLELPADRPRRPAQSYLGDRIDLRLTPELSAGVRDLSKRHGVTMFMTLLSAWAALLSRLGGQSEVVVGSPVANRRRREIEPLMGFFVNTLALRIDVGADPTVAELLAQVKATTLGAYDHQDIPFEQVVDALQPVRALSYSPVFQTMFAFNNTPGGGELALPGLRLSPIGHSRYTAHFDIELALRESGEVLEGNVGYATDLFDRSTVARFVEYFIAVLTAMVSDDRQHMGRLPLMSAPARARVLAESSGERTEARVDRSIQELFQQQVGRSPDAPAAVFDGESVTYAGLNRRANRIAHRLIGLGIQADDRVAICVERSPDLLAGVLGILKAGAAYVPLDPAYPADRLAFMLDDSAPAALLTQTALRDRTSHASSMPTLLLDDESTSAQPDHDPNLPGLATSRLAYVIYTSGSTGQPKGVSMAQGPLLNLLDWHCAQLDHAGGEKVLQFSALGFDVAFQEIFYALCSGGCLMLLREETRQDPFALVEFIRDARVERMFLPFVALQALVGAAGRCGEALPSLKDIVSAGEQLFVNPAIRDFFARVPGRRLHNHYGPTETHVVTAHVMSGDPAQWPSMPSIGRPIANTRIYILDAHRQPVPPGVVGELYIGGACLARGYLNRPGLTGERFLADPFAQEADARMYRTGDLGRWLADGNIEYLGRNDFQVKIRGFRIELGEIEAKLSGCAGVREAVVVAREDGAGGKRLVAYLLAHEGAELSAATLRDALARELAEYMIPGAFVTLDAWPLTPNGKLDRKALPEPDQWAVASREYEAPEGEIETTIAGIWQELLCLERVGRHDQFFELGGHSLMAIQVFHAMEARLGVSLPLASIFASPTVAALAAMVINERPKGSLIVPLQMHGSGRPLFCVHPIGGHVSFYWALAKCSTGMYPVYGVQSPEAAELPLRFNTVEAMAAGYAAAIRGIQPAGPYRLLGWSTGGIAAAAIASHLVEGGQEVEYLGLLDSYLVSGYADKTEQQLGVAAMGAELRSRGLHVDGKGLSSKALAEISIDELLAADFATAVLLAEQSGWANFDAVTFGHLKRQVPVTRNHLKLLSRFQPRHVDIPLQVFWAGQPPDEQTTGPADHGQSDVVAGAKANATHWIDVDHYAMLNEPHVRCVGAAIADFLGHAVETPPVTMAECVGSLADEAIA